LKKLSLRSRQRNLLPPPNESAMTQPTKREQLAAMRIEDFKEHLRMIAGEDPKREIKRAPRPNPMLVRRKGVARTQKRHRR
jgi:hypothetical protein